MTLNRETWKIVTGQALPHGHCFQIGQKSSAKHLPAALSVNSLHDFQSRLKAVLQPQTTA
jgi:hypothetical protein